MLHQLGVIALQLWPHVKAIQQEVHAAMADGDGISAQESDDLGQLVSDRLGNIAIRIGGHDVLRKPAQELILRGAARCARQIWRASQNA